MTTWSSPSRERAEAVLQEPVPRPIAGPRDRFPCRCCGRGRKRGERQTCAQVLRALRRARAELSQADRMAIEAGGDTSVRVRFERDVTAEPGGNVAGAVRRPLFVPGARKPDDPQVWG